MAIEARRLPLFLLLIICFVFLACSSVSSGHDRKIVVRQCVDRCPEQHVDTEGSLSCEKWCEVKEFETDVISPEESEDEVEFIFGKTRDIVRGSLTKEHDERRREAEEREREEEKKEKKRREKEREREHEHEHEREEEREEKEREERHRQEKREREREKKEGKEREHDRGRGRDWNSLALSSKKEKDPSKEEEGEGGEEKRHPHEEEEKGDPHPHEKEDQRHERGIGENDQNNPYHFEPRQFQSLFKGSLGEIRVLNPSKTSTFLSGIENYRMVIYEARPQTFLVPHHSNVNNVLVVLRGKAIITIVNENERESYRIEHGQLQIVPAGSTAYVLNRDSNDVLKIARLVQPLDDADQFAHFFAESYYRVFSNDILEASLNTPREELERLFGEQQRRGAAGERPGVIVKASQSQIKALSEGAKTSQSVGFSTSGGPIDFTKQQPRYHTKNGRLYEASPEDNQQLRDLDVSVTYTKIKKGGVMVPHYNSRATVMVLVVEGTGRFEVASPRQPSGELEMVSADLSPGDVFVVPAGHPFAISSSRNDKLRLLGFNIHAQNNRRNFLAGAEDNVMAKIEREAKELSFNRPGEEVERLFQNQRESYFVKAERSQKRQEKRGSLRASILAGLF